MKELTLLLSKSDLEDLKKGWELQRVWNDDIVLKIRFFEYYKKAMEETQNEETI